MKYCANEFKVSLIWFIEKGVGHRTFKKYKDAVEWAERYLNAKEVVVRITGTLTAEEKNVGGNNIMPVGNGG